MSVVSGTGSRKVGGANIAGALIILFLLKPFADLLWTFRYSIAGFSVTVGHFVGLCVVAYFGRVVLSYAGPRPAGSTLLRVFLYLHLLSIFIGLFYNDRISVPVVMDIMIRIMGSYFLFLAAYIGVVRGNISNPRPIIYAIAVSACAVAVVNVIAIKMGYGGVKAGPQGALDSLRERGLYYDPGALSNVALASILYCVYVVHLISRLKLLVWALCLVVLVADLYLIYRGLSRAVIMELGIFTLIYLFLYQRSWGRLLMPVILVGVALGASMFLTIDYDRLFIRFEQDLQVLEQGQDQSVTVDGGDVSFGAYERLGNNRIANWAYALSEIIGRSLPEILLGNFKSTVAHSDYVDVLSRNGLVGLLLYLFILLRLTAKTGRLLLRSQDPLARVIHFVAFSQLALYMFYAIPFRPLLYTTTVWYMWVGIGISLGFAHLADTGSEQQKPVEKQAVSPKKFLTGRSRRYPKLVGRGPGAA